MAHGTILNLQPVGLMAAFEYGGSSERAGCDTAKDGGAMSNTPLLDWQPPRPFEAKGETFDQSRDGARLGAQCKRVVDFCLCNDWVTLRQISEGAACPEASASARIRDLRRLGGFAVERKYLARGLHAYRVRRV